DPVWLFLDRCRKVGAELGVSGTQNGGRVKKDSRREWARVGVDDLMLVRGEIIIPHHYEFYYFIANKVPSFSKSGGLLFDYSNKPPPPKDNNDPLSRPSDKDLEGADADPTLTKVVDRRWYERNKHIFPASLWREYEPARKIGTVNPAYNEPGSNEYLTITKSTPCSFSIPIQNSLILHYNGIRYLTSSLHTKFVIIRGTYLKFSKSSPSSLPSPTSKSINQRPPGLVFR
ncbi:hypothetical protein T310_8249, partial [Rasamsonia emersonii CBS 393.64]